MKALRRMIALLTVAATIGLSLPYAHAVEYSNDYQGNGYSESRQTPSLVPAIAIGAVAIVAIVAVAIQDNGHGSGHSHSH